MTVVDEKTGFQAFQNLEDIENKMSQIYQAFGEMFPDYKGFWALMAEEEQGHAGLVRKMAVNVREGPLSINKDRFQHKNLRIFLEKLEEKFLQITKTPPALIQALEIAMDLESSLIERKFYEILEEDPILLKGFFSEMQDQLQDHFKRLGSLRAELTGNGP